MWLLAPSCQSNYILRLEFLDSDYYFRSQKSEFAIESWINNNRLKRRARFHECGHILVAIVSFTAGLMVISIPCGLELHISIFIPIHLVSAWLIRPQHSCVVSNVNRHPFPSVRLIYVSCTDLKHPSREVSDDLIRLPPIGAIARLDSVVCLDWGRGARFLAHEGWKCNYKSLIRSWTHRGREFEEVESRMFRWSYHMKSSIHFAARISLLDFRLSLKKKSVGFKSGVLA